MRPAIRSLSDRFSPAIGPSRDDGAALSGASATASVTACLPGARFRRRKRRELRGRWPAIAEGRRGIARRKCFDRALRQSRRKPGPVAVRPLPVPARQARRVEDAGGRASAVREARARTRAAPLGATPGAVVVGLSVTAGRHERGVCG
ncbi:hypothetical protein BJ992_003507 [Sphaerisporangium rubeum]|uniref:Uncharacterized protein n=1 Tax=Sphaerisporangium rubeum TaxID=321317 RepID=A0A7X0IF91_9ACTN|nr:hypothetical protein [Sphaerisporangium rubeum]